MTTETTPEQQECADYLRKRLGDVSVGGSMSISKKPKLLEGGHADNFQTPASALDPLLPYLKKEWTIWEPACGKGNLVEALDNCGFNVFGTDIYNYHDKCKGSDFLEPTKYSFDCVVTNPPFSIKHKFLSRCYDLGRPFALLMPLTTFDIKQRQALFHRKGIEVIFMPKRVNFETPNGKGSSSWFATAWFTWGLNLPSQLVFSGVELDLETA